MLMVREAGAPAHLEDCVLKAVGWCEEEAPLLNGDMFVQLAHRLRRSPNHRSACLQYRLPIPLVRLPESSKDACLANNSRLVCDAGSAANQQGRIHSVKPSLALQKAAFSTVGFLPTCPVHEFA